MTEERVDVIQQNWDKFLEDGPRLRYDYSTEVVAKDSKRGVVLIDGLGCCGVGQMWFKMTDRHKDKPGFDDALEVDTGNEPLFGIGRTVGWMRF